MVAQSHLFKFFVLAIVCLIIGLLLNCALPAIISQLIDKQIALSQDSQTFPMWKEPPVPIYQKFYFYNVTNAHEIEQFGHKPQLVEVGPFTYRASMSKRDIEFKSDSDATNSAPNSGEPAASPANIISYKNFKSWQFEPELSIADQSFEIITLNAPLAITLSLIQSASNAVRLLVTVSLDGLSEGFFTRRSIRQLLFDGYPDLLTTFGPLLNAEMLSQGGHFGYMNARNNSLDGSFEVNSGVDDVAKLNTIKRYNGRSKLAYWHDSPAHCNSLEGATPGELFPRLQAGQQQAIKLFQPDFCRVWRLDLDSEFEQASSGLHLKRFRATRDIFKNSSELPENSCFFSLPSSASGHHNRRTGASSSNGNGVGAGQQHHRTSSSHHGSNRVGRQNRPGGGGHHAPPPPSPPLSPASRAGGHSQTRGARQEWPSGVFSLAPCKFNAPIYMSMPHFLDADPHYLSQVSGLAPDAQKHEFYADLEPRTGSPVSLKARVQLNVAISKPPGLVRFRNIPEIMFPVFWQELTVNLTGPVIDQLHLAARGAQEANTRISHTFLILGASLLIITSLFHLHARYTSAASGHKSAAGEPKGATGAPTAPSVVSSSTTTHIGEKE